MRWELQGSSGADTDALHPFHGLDVWSLFRRQSVARRDRPFLVWQPYGDDEGRTWTYAEAFAEASAVAAALVQRGVQPRDAVIIHLENSPEFVFAWFACAAVGAVAVTTNARSAGPELRYYADDCGAVGAVTQPRYADLVSASCPDIKWQVVTSNDAGERSSAVVGGSDSYRSLTTTGGDVPVRPADPAWPMSVQYTSGTTSRPKGVLWTHANALWGARVNAAHEDLRSGDRHLVYHPLFHTNAMAFSVLASLWVGAAFVLVPKWSTSRFWDVSISHGCTWLSLMSLSYRVLLETEAAPGHRYRLFGGAVGDTPLDARYGVKTIGWWAMTETISHPIVGSPHSPDRPMSMGRPAPEYQVAVVGDDGRTPVSQGETGELLVRGTPGLSLFAGYLNRDQETAESFDDRGWFHTGDLVVPHDDGYLTFGDRAKDMLRVGGENVSASEVERVLLATGNVSEAAVVGRSDESLDEVPVAFVKLRPEAVASETELVSTCTAQLAGFKVPRSVHIVPELPRSTLGKVDKRVLRETVRSATDPLLAAREWVVAAATDPSGEADFDPDEKLENRSARA